MAPRLGLLQAAAAPDPAADLLEAITQAKRLQVRFDGMALLRREPHINILSGSLHLATFSTSAQAISWIEGRSA